MVARRGLATGGRDRRRLRGSGGLDLLGLRLGLLGRGRLGGHRDRAAGSRQDGGSGHRAGLRRRGRGGLRLGPDERGLVRVDAFKQALTLTSAPANKTEWVGWGSDTDLGLVQDFLETVQTGREPTITGTDGLKALEVALAAYRSAEEKKSVALG